LVLVTKTDETNAKCGGWTYEKTQRLMEEKQNEEGCWEEALADAFRITSLSLEESCIG
jgi:hypothetical protein